MSRDDYRCVISGLVDSKHRHLSSDKSTMTTKTELAHILPFALGKFNENNSWEVSKLGSFQELLANRMCR
jgi:hypothetical protein